MSTLFSPGISASDLGSNLPRVTPQSNLPVHSRTASPDKRLASLIYKYISDVPDDALVAVTDAVMTLLLDQEISDQSRQLQIEELLDLQTPLSYSDMELMISIAQEKATSTSEVPGDLSDNSDLMDESEDLGLSDDDSEPNFIALNDPIRLRTSVTVRPEDIDAHWLEKKLETSMVTVPDLLAKYQHLRDMSLQERQTELEQLLGTQNLALSQVLSHNLDTIVLYTRLALADSPNQRDAVEKEIADLNLNADMASQEYMNEDLPRKLDLGSTGRPITEPIDISVDLPANSTKLSTTLYEQFNIPALSGKKTVDWPLIETGDLPVFARGAFLGIRTLNPIQSKVANTVLHSEVNILVCAPTGAGKTNIALLGITKCLNHGLRVVYISPQKALVQEQVATLQKRLPEFQVSELSGDNAMSRFQLTSVDVIVSTPEKWDIVSRKKSNVELLRSVGLVVTDEIHLLHDEQRGGIMENIVIRHKDVGSRLIGLSATLPNYRDVAEFMLVPPAGLFYFDASFRPVPLEQQYVGVHAQSPIKKREAINMSCVDKVRQIVVDRKKQVLVFVHSRKDTATTRELLLSDASLNLSQESVGIHHAGLSKEQRARSESTFRDGSMRVLVCTATLAWGVNLPAAAVIIKGTELYNPNAKGWQQLRPQDVLQMLGRAGRPGFDSEGLGVIITSRDYLGYFASIATMSVPIESHLMFRIVDSINAEVVLNNIKTIEDGCQWIKRSFWAVRWRADPFIYGDNYRLEDLVHSVFLKLSKVGSAVYDYPNIRPTGQGELASNFYITPESMGTYVRKLKPWYAESEIIDVFALSEEFKALTVRPGEEAEIERLKELVPIPVKDNSSSIAAKLSVLLQTYISRLPLSGLTLQNDTVYIAQSASRLFRAIFELAVDMKWGVLARAAHRLYAMVDHQLWVGQSPFRQFPGYPEQLARNAESNNLRWLDYFHLSDSDLASVLRTQDSHIIDFARKCLASFPRFHVNSRARTLSSDWLVLTMSIVPIFDSDDIIEEVYEGFYVLAEDQSGNLAFAKRFSLEDLMNRASTSHEFHIRLSQISRSPYLYVKIIGDRWLSASSESLVNLRGLELPLDDDNLHIVDAAAPAIEESGIDEAELLLTSPVLRALKPLLYDTERSTFLGLPPGGDQLQCARLAIARASKLNQRVLLLYPDTIKLDPGIFDVLNLRFMSVSTAERLSRTLTKLEYEFSDIDSLVCLELHKVGSEDGHLYELALTRLIRYWKSRNLMVRIIGLALPVKSGSSLGSWLGVKRSDQVSFELTVREPSFPNVDIQIFDGSMVTCLKSAAVTKLLMENLPTLIIASSGRQKLKIERELKLLLEMRETSLEMVKVVSRTEELTPMRPGEYSNTIIFCPSELALDEVVENVGLATDNAVVFTIEPEFTATHLINSLPIESSMDQYLGDALIPEILAGNVGDPQGAIEYFSSTFLYRRVKANPGYYDCKNLQVWVSELVQSTFESLASLNVIEITDEESLDVKPLELCHILAYSGANVSDLVSLTNNKASDIPQNDPRKAMSIIDKRILLSVAISSPLSVLFELIDLRQSHARSTPNSSSSLLQIPWVDDEIVQRSNDAGVYSMLDFVAIEDDDLRSTLLGFTNDDARMVDVAEFVNEFPIVDIIGVNVTEEEPTRVTLRVEIERDMDEDDTGSGENSAENTWFVIVGDPLENLIMGFKQIVIDRPLMQAELAVTGELKNAKVWLMSGDYIDADKEQSL